ncbi:class II fructose-1,6-bisphosphate aldolase [Candidatus Woesearchaeota archaeon]|nr:class II fructose-1,6-bisphosphate aldolase [Candidatus Woesearchaeota archaeon]
MIISLKRMLAQANKKNYAVGAYNINNMEFVQAVVSASEKMNSPAIISTTEGAIRYAGMPYLKTLVYTAAAHTKIPITFHLDHGRDFTVIKQAIKAGYSSIMYDGSHLPFKENVRNTAKVVRWAHKKGVSVEGELGTIGGAEDLVSSREIIYTDPDTAKEFVEKTGVDALAIAIGTSHGAYKFSSTPTLDIARLKTIKKLTKLPLVLHGASEVPQYLVRQANRYGATLGKARGVPDAQIRQAVKHGINKVNEDTDLRLAFLASTRKTLVKQPSVFDPRKILGPARDYVQKIVEDRIKLLGSKGKA